MESSFMFSQFHEIDPFDWFWVTYVNMVSSNASYFQNTEQL